MDSHAEITETLARRAQGNPAEFAVLYERIAPRLYTWARVRVRPPLAAHLSAEDLVQEVWWRAFSSFQDFDTSKGSFSGWIFTIATRQLLNAFRSLRQGIAAPTSPLHSDDAILSGAHLSRDLAQNELLQRVYSAVSAMPSEDQDLVIHCGIEGLPTTEVASMLNLNPETARKRWQRLRAQLRESIPEGRDTLGY